MKFICMILTAGLTVAVDVDADRAGGLLVRRQLRAAASTHFEILKVPANVMISDRFDH